MKKAFSFILAIAILVLCSSCSGANTLTDEEIELFRNMMTTSITSDSTSVNSTFNNDERITTTIIKDITTTKKAEIRTTNKPVPTSSPKTECSHSYFERTVNPTCTEEGYTIHTCEKCGKSFKDSIIPSRHEYVNYRCSSCGKINPGHGYDYLKIWLLENGNVNGEQVGIRYYPDENTQYKVCYDATDDYICATYQVFDSSSYFFLLNIKTNGGKNEIYCSLGENPNMYTALGSLVPSTFTNRSPISIIKYNGDSSDRNYVAEMLRLSSYDMVEFLDWMFDEYQIGITISDIGFTSYEPISSYTD